MLSLDRWAVDRALVLQQEVIESYDRYSFLNVYQKVHNFCALDMGSFYLDIIKDRQYTTKADSVARRSCQTAMYQVLEAMIRWIAPILSFTADELWQAMPGERGKSVFLETWYEALEPLADDRLGREYWETIMAVKTAANKAMEAVRNAGSIGAGLDAEVILYAEDTLQENLLKLGEELRFVLITSGATVKPLSEGVNAVDTDMEGLKVSVVKSSHEKCPRCWHRREDIGRHEAHKALCGRCVDNIEGDGEGRQFA